MRARARIVALGLAAAMAAVAVLLGRGVLAIPDEIRSGDARLARPDLAANVEIDSSTPFGGIAETLVGAGDDRSYRRALQRYHASRVDGLAVADQLSLHGEAEAMLTRLARTHTDRVLRARAANLLGVLLFEDARLDPISTRRYLELSLGAFQDAVRLDPAFTEAKHNLELLATLPPDTAFGKEEQPGSDASATPLEDRGY